MKHCLHAFILVALIIGSCKEKPGPIITIVETAETRTDIGKQLEIINKLSPRVIALDFFLVPDSAEIDSILVKELNLAKNTIQVVGLHDHLHDDIWDSLEVSHPKFRVAGQGFANFIIEDSIVLRELPMRQIFHGKPVYSFSYSVAEMAAGVKPKYQNKGGNDLMIGGDDYKNYRKITIGELFSGKFNKRDITNKIVILGYFGQDEDYLSVDNMSEKVNGVEIHASFINELIDTVSPNKYRNHFVTGN